MTLKAAEQPQLRRCGRQPDGCVPQRFFSAQHGIREHGPRVAARSTELEGTERPLSFRWIQGEDPGLVMDHVCNSSGLAFFAICYYCRYSFILHWESPNLPACQVCRTLPGVCTGCKTKEKLMLLLLEPFD